MATTFQRPRGEQMIEVEEAQRRVLAEVAVLGAEEVALADALGRVLREDVAAPEDVPQRDNSAMDGYAVRAEDVADAPLSLRVIEDLRTNSVIVQARPRDMREVVPEAWELVEHGHIDEAQFRAFTFDNPVRLWAGMNPDFFKGTVVEGT